MNSRITESLQFQARLSNHVGFSGYPAYRINDPGILSCALAVVSNRTSQT